MRNGLPIVLSFVLSVVVGCATAFGAIATTSSSESPAVDVIVQFRQPAGAATRLSVDAIATRAEVLAERLVDLRRDLASIGKTAGVSSRSLDEPRVRRMYHRVLLGVSLRVPRAMLPALEALPYVASVHEDQQYKAFRDDTVAKINAKRVWTQFGTRGAGVTVAVIDSGIDYTHPALGGGFGAGFKVIGGWDFVDNDADPRDSYGHGTHVAGIIAANSDELLGVAPEASLLAYRAMGNDGNGKASDVIAAIERSVDPNGDGDPSDHVDVINLSLGGPPIDNDPGAAAVEKAIAAGIVVCIAAGNNGDNGTVSTPGIAPSAITVGATDAFDNIASFSSRGPAVTYGLKPEVVAPGVEVFSSMPDGAVFPLSGTSMATPHVAGVAALVKSMHRDWSPAAIKSAIVTTSAALTGDVMNSGSGRLDALGAMAVTTLISPPIISFGRDDVTKAVWSTTTDLTLRNVSTQPETLTAAVHGLRDGIVLRATPSTVTIAPGASVTVRVDLEVTNAAVSPPLDGSLSFGGQIEWSGGAVPIHVPWAFVKGTFLTIEAVGFEKEGFAELLGTTFKRTSGFFVGIGRVLSPIDTVDLVFVESPRFSTALADRVVFAEQVDTGATTRVTLSMATAQFVVTTAATDEKGGPLVTPNRDCKDQFVFAFPSGRKLMREQLATTPTRFGPLSERVKLYVANHCADAETASLYTSIHDVRNGLNASTISAPRGRWIRNDVAFEAGPRGELTIAHAAVRAPGAESSFLFSAGRPFIFRSSPSRLTIYSVPGSAPGLDLLTRLERYSRCNRVAEGGAESTCTEISSAFLYLGENDVRVDGDLYLDVSPMAFKAPTGVPLTFGPGPYWAQFVVFDNSRFFQATSNWGGQLSESRYFQAAPPRVTLRNAAGEPIGQSTPDGFVVKELSLDPGAYRIDAVLPQYFVANAPASATASGFFDNRRGDSRLPQWTGMRIVDAAGQPIGSVRENAAATLLFSVADLRHDGIAERRVPPREEATRVEYRRHGTNTWLPLAPLVEARQYLPAHNVRVSVGPGQVTSVPLTGVGTMYRVDLSSATRLGIGGIDLRLHAEDDSGNAVELLLEPALVIEGSATPRRRVFR